jgi:hypothetical protein
LVGIKKRKFTETLRLLQNLMNDEMDLETSDSIR